MAVERVLTDRIGDLGKKIHTGRSRNDQVSTDFKLYMRHRAKEIRALVVELQKSVLDVAKKNFGKIMPGYTHLQQAQPILFSHYMMSLFFALSRDVKRLDNFLDLHVELPLGSGAIAGSAFPYHRQLVAEELGFERPSANSIDAVSHRDMEMYELINENAPISSRALKNIGNYRKGGKKGFETIITRLQSQCYVLVSDFTYARNKNGDEYGWGIAEYSTPEKFFGEDYCNTFYERTPEESYKKILRHMHRLFPDEDDEVTRKILG